MIEGGGGGGGGGLNDNNVLRVPDIRWWFKAVHANGGVSLMLYL